jgi:hypothetical protein
LAAVYASAAALVSAQSNRLRDEWKGQSWLAAAVDKCDPWREIAASDSCDAGDERPC